MLANQVADPVHGRSPFPGQAALRVTRQVPWEQSCFSRWRSFVHARPVFLRDHPPLPTLFCKRPGSWSGDSGCCWPCQQLPGCPDASVSLLAPCPLASHGKGEKEGADVTCLTGTLGASPDFVPI